MPRNTIRVESMNQQTVEHQAKEQSTRPQGLSPRTSMQSSSLDEPIPEITSQMLANIIER